MKVIKIVLSPAQKTKLRKGLKIRINKKNKPVIEGAGIYMLVKPENYNVLTKTFEGKRGREFKLDEEELDINQNPEGIQDEEVKEVIEGSGLFSRIKRGFRKLKKFYREKVRDTKAGKAIRGAVKLGSKVAIKAAINSLAGTPLAPLMPALKLANMKYGEKGINAAIEKIGLGMHTMVGNGLRLGSGMHQTDEEAQAHKEVEDLLKQAPDMEVQGGKMHYGMGMHGDGLTVKRGAPKVKKGGKIQLRDDKKFPNFILDKQNMLPVKGSGVRLRGDGLHAGKGLRLGGGNELIGLDEPPATHAIPKARKLVKTSMLTGKSR
jgi:hypothetical protein